MALADPDLLPSCKKWYIALKRRPAGYENTQPKLMETLSQNLLKIRGLYESSLSIRLEFWNLAIMELFP